MDWAPLYPAFVGLEAKPEPGTVGKLVQDVEVADIGCGFGGLLVALAPKLPNTLLLGTPHHSLTRINS
jgi:tRNA (guanine-N7-)-methyltransferase